MTLNETRMVCWNIQNRLIFFKDSMVSPDNSFIINFPVGWGCRIHWLHFCRGVRHPHLTSVLDMTLNNLMVRFQQCWSFGECGVPLHCHWHTYAKMNCLIKLNSFKIEMFLTIKLYLHLNCMLMLNWIIWNRTVFRH